MILLGLTGGIGMGKTACETLLRARGVSTIDTDALSRDLVKPGEPALNEIRAAFGEQVIDASGALLRRDLARIVFNDPDARRRLESILHPRIRAAWSSAVEQWRSGGVALVVVVIPLLFETGARPEFDRVLCVSCSAATQHRRLTERGWTREQIARRLQAQWPAERKAAESDHVIWAEGSLEAHAAQVDLLLRRLRPGVV